MIAQGELAFFHRLGYPSFALRDRLATIICLVPRRAALGFRGYV
jgi:hypothetical protein